MSDSFDTEDSIPGEPEIINGDVLGNVILLCDHASNVVPDEMGDLGLASFHLEDHIAWDIGVGALTRIIADIMGVPAVLATASRLVLDTNREPGNPTLIPEISDGIKIPGNQNLSDADKSARLDRFHAPFHAACDRVVQKHLMADREPILIAVHSYTPSFNGDPRPWDVGMMWNQDNRLAEAMIGLLERETDLVVGDNVPYSGKDLFYTLQRHGADHGLPASTLEIRNDNLCDAAHIRAWAVLLADLFDEASERQDLFN